MEGLKEVVDNLGKLPNLLEQLGAKLVESGCEQEDVDNYIIALANQDHEKIEFYKEKLEKYAANGK